MEKVQQGKEDGGMGGGVWVEIRVVRDLSLRRHLSRELKEGSECLGHLGEYSRQRATASTKALKLKHARYTYWWSS